MRNMLIMDSGVGGLALLRKLLYATPSNFVYFADTANFPYGHCERSRLQYLAETNLLMLADKFTFDTVIVACNTLTLASVNYLKQIFPQYTFVGCEPPIKQALQYTVSRPLLVGTPFTVNKIVESGEYNQIQCAALPNLASMVEDGATDRQLNQYIEQCLSQFFGFDSIILGCTHYSAVKSNFQQLFPTVKIFDSVDGVYSRVKKLCGKKKPNSESSIKFEFSQDSGANEVKYRRILEAFHNY